MVDETFKPLVPGGTRAAFSLQVRTPGSNDASTNLPPGVAVPVAVFPRGEYALRQFEIKGVNGEYSPRIIVVNEGDVVDVSLSAVDDDYNIFFPDFEVGSTAKEGQTRRVQFQGFPFGQYVFFCKDACGTNKTEGVLIVNR